MPPLEKLTKDRVIEIFVCSLAFILGCLRGGDISYSEQVPVYEALRNISAIIFGVAGAWYAVLIPLVGKEDENGVKGKIAEYKDKLLPRLIVPIRYSVYILVYSLVVPILAPVVKLFEFHSTVCFVLRVFSFGFVCSMSALQLTTLLRALMPFDWIQTNTELEQRKREQDKRLKGNITTVKRKK